jgi:hypothetical protein
LWPARFSLDSLEMSPLESGVEITAVESSVEKPEIQAIAKVEPATNKDETNRQDGWFRATKSK